MCACYVSFGKSVIFQRTSTRIREIFRSWEEETVKVLFFHARRRPLEERGKLDGCGKNGCTPIYSRLFSGTRKASRVPLHCVFTAECKTNREPSFDTISSRPKKCQASRKHLSRARRKRVLFRFTSDLVAQLCLKRQLATVKSRTGAKSGSLSMHRSIGDYGHLPLPLPSLSTPSSPPIFRERYGAISFLRIPNCL